MKIAIVSYWHVHASDYTGQIAELPGSEVVAVWDEDKARGKEWAEKIGCKFYEDYDSLLKDEEIEGVVITSETSKHPELITKAANAKRHIFTEKVLALKTEDALAIQKAVLENNVRFTISLPHKCKPELWFAKELITKGTLGDITYARVRNVHNGSIAGWLPEHFYDEEACGGGAMIDLGAHPMYLLPWVLGKPKTVQSLFTKVTGRAVEDNAVSLLEFANGAIGVSETGFVSVHTPFTMEIGGTKGTLLIHNTVSYAAEETGGKWVTPEKLPEPPAMPMKQWIESVKTGKDNPLFGIEEAVDLTKVMEAAYTSCRTGKKAEVK